MRAASASAARDGAPVTAVPLLPRRSQLRLRGPRLLLGGGLRLPRLGQLRLGLPRGQARLPRISLGLLGPGLKPGPGLLGRRDLRLEPGSQPGLVPLGVLAGLRHLLLCGPARPVQLRPGRLGRLLRLGQPRLSLPALADPGSPYLLGPRLLLGGSRRGQRLRPPPLSLRRRSTRLPRISLGALSAGLKPGPGLRLGRLSRPRRVLSGLVGPGLGLPATRDSAPATRDSAPRTASSRSCRAAATCSRAARASCSACSPSLRRRRSHLSRAATASCSAAAVDVSASARRASASAAAARASRASASARSARA